MADCASCGLPPCTCRCALVDLGTWYHVIGQLMVAQTVAPVAAKRAYLRRDYAKTLYELMSHAPRKVPT